MELLQKLKFNRDGLVPVVVQDADSGDVLMLGWMNREALKATLRTGKAHFFSRSRRRIWRKGEVSGHEQKIHEIRFDCDEDCLLIKVHQRGGACHQGYRSCFYRRLRGEGDLEIVEKRIFNPEEVYKEE